MKVKKWLVALKKIVPTEMERYLEEMAAEGYQLRSVGEMGLFYFEFDETENKKSKYVVDISALPKVSYMETLLKKEWEYLGKTGNCYIWRKNYEDKRPEDFADKICRKKHCFRLGLIFSLFALLIGILMCALGWGIMFELRQGIKDHVLAYAIEIVLQIPFLIYFIWGARKLLAER
jgi:hypothetical protein